MTDMYFGSINRMIIWRDIKLIDLKWEIGISRKKGSKELYVERYSLEPFHCCSIVLRIVIKPCRRGVQKQTVLDIG